MVPKAMFWDISYYEFSDTTSL